MWLDFLRRADHSALVVERGEVPPSLAWMVRVCLAVLLLVGAWWWSGFNFSGDSYCQTHGEEFCDGPGFETEVPPLLWIVTLIASVLVCVIGITTSPRERRQ